MVYNFRQNLTGQESFSNGILLLQVVERRSEFRGIANSRVIILKISFAEEEGFSQEEKRKGISKSKVEYEYE